MKSSKKSWLLTLFFFAILTGFILFVLVGNNQRERELKTTPIHGYAVIVEIYTGAKAKRYVKYRFTVSGVIYEGHQRFFPHRELVSVGDTVELVFAGTNPEISRLLRDENNLLKIKRGRSNGE